MGTALERAFASIFIIVLGYFLKRVGLFGKDDYDVAAKICMNVTLPAAIITGFGSYEQDYSLFIVVLLGALCNAAMIAAAWFITARSARKERIFQLFALPGYQIGTFTLPYIGGILGPYGILVTCMFDMGNALFACGGTYAIVSASPAVEGAERLPVKELIKRVFSTVPFLIYIIAMVWVSLGLTVPGWLLVLAAPIGAANALVAMFMIGMMIEIRLGRGELAAASATLAIRYAVSAALALFLYFCTPFPLVIRQVLALVVFSPVSALAPIFTARCGGDIGLAGFAGSISIILSIAAMTVCMMLMGI
ncbi:AEC family transporter [Cloacibacillus porcorum]|uniref:AEC family transporter n=1 Tax=uncultured Cloacibacillus sp. TaxID=889794 RepID=UPI0027D968D4|nr:hypothetical protein [uncultured Cloacibacillus sp.]